MENESYPTERKTNDDPPEESIKTMENMTQMAQYVYQMYCKKLETIKDQLPQESSADTEMYANIPTEETIQDSNNDGEEENELASMEVYEPPAKKANKDVTSKDKNSTAASSKAFKPTPIVNEIEVDEEEVEKQQEKTEDENKNEAKSSEEA